ncbi:MAG: hypothetical protein QW663_07130 [Nitrososphaerota archaeon]
MSGKTVYDEVVEVWSLEKTSEAPVKISEDLLKRLKEYAEELRIRLRLAVDRESIHSKLCERELEVLTTLVSEIFKARMKKIVNAAMSGEALENLLPVENRLYESLLKSLAVHREIVDADGVERGPFREGAIASLDHRTADLLERGGYVRRLPLIRGSAP